jgi:hypothetical protein
MARSVSILVWLVWLSGCAWRRAPATDARAAALAVADSGFAARVTAKDVDVSVAAWSALLARDPSDGEVLARLAHAEWVRAQLVPPSEALTHFEVGEEYGWRCLSAVPAFEAARRGNAGRVVPGVVEGVGADRAPCLVWTAVHVVERAARRGDGADLALAEAGVLLARARAIGGEPSPWAPVPGLEPWASARLEVLTARDVADATQGGQALARVARAYPSVARWACDARRAGADVVSPPEGATDAPEERAVRERWDACAPDAGGTGASGGDEP